VWASTNATDTNTSSGDGQPQGRNGGTDDVGTGETGGGDTTVNVDASQEITVEEGVEDLRQRIQEEFGRIEDDVVRQVERKISGSGGVTRPTDPGDRGFRRGP